jgi:ribosomal protein L11 methyltransferase
VAFACPAALAEALAEAIDDGTGAVAIVLEPGSGTSRVEAILPHAPDPAALELRLALIAAALGISAPPVSIASLPPQDWLARNRASFGAIAIGPFLVHGSEPVATGRLSLRIDAATAFGTGEHATTKGCLLALGAIAKRRRIARVLDMGTGSGILAIAAAKITPASVVAVDVDPESIAVARRHARLNGVANRMAIGVSNGYRSSLVRRRAPYDLVLANILARPLAAMAKDLARVLAPGGVAVLSGLLAEQERAVLRPHRDRGLALARRLVIDGWATLVLGRYRRKRVTSPTFDC